MNKKCTCCLREKPEEEFFKKNSKSQKREQPCKACKKEKTRLHKLKNPEIWKAKEKRRHQRRKANPEYAIKRRCYREKNRDRLYERQKEWAVRNKEKRAKSIERWLLKNKHKKDAHYKVRNALKRGRLSRGKCFCGGSAHAHHEDYSKPLEVVWLCPTHHKQRHRELNEKNNG